ncbi:MAG: phosphoglycerate kinase [Dehalococcoidia bacterium]|nr:phosphoglycerate kinase [Dehalococcoidia bacterium]
MTIKTLKDVQVAGKRVLVRVDYNVINSEGGPVASLSRLRASLPTIAYLVQHNAKVVLCSHLGRPGGKMVEGWSLLPVRNELQKLLGMSVAFAGDCVGPVAQTAVATLKPGQVLLLENVRFHPGDEKNSPDFARDLASLADLFVEDGFGVVHRSHASTVGVAQHLPSVAGLLLEKELAMLSHVLDNPRRPLVAIMGGAKISDKVAVVESLLNRVDALAIGGGMAATFFRAKGWATGASLVEADAIPFAGKAMQQAQARGVKLLLPTDVVVTLLPASAKDPSKLKGDVATQVVPADHVPAGCAIVDVGPATIEAFSAELRRAKTVFWNGPMGIFEVPAFSHGTRKLVDELTGLKDVTTIVGGGSTAEVVEALGVEGRFSHVSTGGGATLECLAGQELPGVAALKGKHPVGG